MDKFTVKQVGEHNNKNLVDVIFMHGLTGDSELTWGAKRILWKPRLRMDKWRISFEKNVNHFWPNHLKDANVWTAGYPAPLFEAFHRGKIEQLYSEEGEAALRELVDNELGSKKIVFVAHSLGGLLVKAILKRSSEAEVHSKRQIVENTQAVFFLGTPHSGSNRVILRHLIPYAIKLAVLLITAWLMSFLALPHTSLGSAIFNIPSFGITITAEDVVQSVIPLILVGVFIYLLKPSRHVELLDPANPQLRVLTKHYREVLRKHPLITTVAFYEALKIPFLGVLVPWSSADPGVTNCEPEELPASHTQLCKRPEVTKTLKERVQAAVERAAGKRPVFGEDVERLFRGDETIKKLCDSGNFEVIPSIEDGVPVRAITEEKLRLTLRDSMRDGPLKPSALQLEKATESTFELDKFVRKLWYETDLVGKLRELREFANQQRMAWSKDPAAKWNLIPFNRALRTIEHVYSGDFLKKNATVKDPPDLKALLLLVESSHNELQGRYEPLAASDTRPDENGRVSDGRDAVDTRPDGDGRTRWLLLRMECALKAMETALDFIGYPDNPRGEKEPKKMADKRRSKRETFLKQLDEFKKKLGGTN